MAHQTGENDQALRKIIDFTRLLSIVLLSVHFYFYFYEGFNSLGFTHSFIDKVLGNIAKTKLFSNFHISKIASLILLLVSLLGAKGRKEQKIKKSAIARFLILGFLFFFVSYFSIKLPSDIVTITVVYIGITSAGYIFILTGGTLLSRLIKIKMSNDPFNKENETFPQEERLLENEFSINLPTKYNLKGKIRKGWINIINPFRATLVIGTPGAGKSYFVIRHAITQHVEKGFSMFLYDFKFDDLSKIAFNALLKNVNSYKVPPKFYVINFDDLTRSHRCNPLNPEMMHDITDATESSRTFLLGLNRDWIKKQGEFFVESPINFVTALIWYLKKYKGGKYCTLPHVIELMQKDYDDLFPILGSEKEIEALINPFVSAYLKGAAEQLEGQIASAKIAIARLSSPSLYWVLSGNDINLDINNPDEPKILCVGNNPQKKSIYGSVLSLYISRVTKLVNQKGKLKSSLIFDEFPTIYFNDIDAMIATARSNYVSTMLGIQDFSQLKKDYGRDQAEVIMNIVGNIISGQVVGETAKNLSERVGKINQEKNSISINSSDTSISRSTQLDFAVPASKISALSSGEFVGAVTDNPEEKIELKAFHCEIINDHEAIKRETDNYVDIPPVSDISMENVHLNYLRIKEEVQEIVNSEIDRIKSDPALAHLIIEKPITSR